MNTASKPLSTPEVLARRRVLAESFNRAAQTFEEAALSAQKMVESLEKRGVLLKAPRRPPLKSGDASSEQ